MICLFPPPPPPPSQMPLVGVGKSRGQICQGGWVYLVKDGYVTYPMMYVMLFTLNEQTDAVKTLPSSKYRWRRQKYGKITVLFENVTIGISLFDEITISSLQDLVSCSDFIRRCCRHQITSINIVWSRNRRQSHCTNWSCVNLLFFLSMLKIFLKYVLILCNYPTEFDTKL